MKLSLGFLSALVVLIIGTSVPAEIISNGDFEATPFDTDWSHDWAELGPGLGGSPQSAMISRSATLLQQVPDALGLDGTLNSILVTYTINFDVLDNNENRVRIQGSYDAGPRHIISSRWSSTGMDIFNGLDGTWLNVVSSAELGGSVLLDTDYIVTFDFAAGDGMGGASPSYDLKIAWDGNSLVKQGVTVAHYGLPSNLASDQGPVTGIKFFGGPKNVYYVDDVSIGAVPIPEPTSLALMGIALTGLAMARRRFSQPCHVERHRLSGVSQPTSDESVSSAQTH